MISTPTKTDLRIDPAAAPAKRADDKRPGALCHRAYCVNRALGLNLAALIIGATGRKTKTIRVVCSADGRLAVKHNRGSAKDRRARAAALAKRYDRCVWCGTPVDADTLEQDRVIGSCEYSARNLVAACKCCNNQRNRCNTGDDAWSFAQNDAAAPEMAQIVLAQLVADNPDFFG